MSATAVVPFKITRHSDELQTNVRRVVGYRAECDCGYVGPVRIKRETVQWDKMVHRHRAHRGS